MPKLVSGRAEEIVHHSAQGVSIQKVVLKLSATEVLLRRFRVLCKHVPVAVAVAVSVAVVVSSSRRSHISSSGI